MDLDGKDACDMAMENDFVKEMYEFINCNMHKKLKVRIGQSIAALSADLIDQNRRRGMSLEQEDLKRKSISSPSTNMLRK